MEKGRQLQTLATLHPGVGRLSLESGQSTAESHLISLFFTSLSAKLR